MIAILKAMDLYFYQINFNYKREKFFHSMFGYIFSFIIYILIILFFSCFSYDLFFNTNPLIIFKENEFNGNFTIPFKKLFKKLNYHFNYNDSSGSFGYALKNIKNISNPLMFIELSILNFKNHMYESFIFNENVEINFDEEKRLYNIKANEVFDYTKEILFFKGDFFLKNYFEINFNNYEKRMLKDVNLTFYDFSELSLKFIFNKDYLNNFIEGNLDISDFQLYYQISDHIMKVDDPDFFYEYDFEEKLIINSFKSKNFPHVRFSYKYGITKLIDDDGFIFNQSEETDQIKKSFETFSIDIVQSVFIDVFKLRFDNIIKIYERKYKKLQIMVAELGGFINIFIIFGKFVCYGFNQNKFYYDVIKEIFGTDTGEMKSFDGETFNIINKIDKKKIDVNEDIKSKSSNYSKYLNRSHGNDIYSREIFEMENLKNNIILTEDHRKGPKVRNELEFPMKNEEIRIQNENSKKANGDGTDAHKPVSILEKKIQFEMLKVNNLQNISNLLTENKRKKIKNLSFSFFDFIKLFLSCKYFKNKVFLEQEKIFIKFAKIISHNLDIMNYFRLFHEFEKLKIITINENQT